MEVRRKVIAMGERDVIQEAKTMIKTLQTAFSRDCKTSPNALRFEENLNHILEVLVKARRLLIELEKFYQSTSLLIGLGELGLSEEAYQAWRAYDHWHYEVVKPRLQVYGPTVLL